MDPAPPPPVPPPPGSALRHVLLATLVCVLLVGGGFVAMVVLAALRAEPQKAPRTVTRAAVHVVPAARTGYEERLTGYGRARALRSADVPAEVGATVVWLAASLEAGSRVHAGEELVRLDDRDARASLDAAEARVRQSEAAAQKSEADLASLAAQAGVAQGELEAARRELARLTDLVAKATSESEVDGQRMAVSLREQAVLALLGRHAAAEADLARARAEAAAGLSAVRQAALTLERCVVRAPYDGAIVARAARLGERVAPGAPLFSIVDVSVVEVPVSLSASRHGEIAVGARAEVRLREGGDVVWTGEVARVAAVADAATRTFEAYLEIRGADGAPAAVAPGAFVLATIAGRRTEDVFVVPREAFVGPALFVAAPGAARDDVQGAREAVVAEVRPHVRRRTPDALLVDQGLEPGALVVVSGVDQLADGAHVLILEDAEGGR